MDLGFLAFLADPWFVAAWALAGAAGAGLAYRRAGPGRRTAAAAAVGALVFPPLALAPARRAAALGPAAAGFLGALLLARAARLGFAAELWLEFLAFAAGLLLRGRAGGRPPALVAEGILPAAAALAAGGTITGLIQPLVVGAAPPPWTLACWGFAALALAVALPSAELARRLAALPATRAGAPAPTERGARATVEEAPPRSPRAEAPAETSPPRALRAPAASAGASLLALGLLAIPAALHAARLERPIPLAPDVVEELEESDEPLHRLAEGALATAAVGARALREGNRSRAVPALEAARRAAAVAESAGGPTGAATALDRSLRSLQNRDDREALASAQRALFALGGHGSERPAAPPDPATLRGAPVIDAQGLPIGRVAAARDGCLALALDRGRRVEWPAAALVLGDAGRGRPLVAVPEFGADAGARPARACPPA